MHFLKPKLQFGCCVHFVDSVLQLHPFLLNFCLIRSSIFIDCFPRRDTIICLDQLVCFSLSSCSSNDLISRSFFRVLPAWATLIFYVQFMLLYYRIINVCICGWMLHFIDVLTSSFYYLILFSYRNQLL